MSRLRLGLVFGGRSAEHHVSLVSAKAVRSALDPDKYRVILIGITPDGGWITGEDAERLLNGAPVQAPRRVFLPPDPGMKRLVARSQRVADVELDVLFPVLHGPYGEDGTLQGLCEMAGLPCVGAGVLGSAVCMDKIIQKVLCRSAGLPVVDYLWFRGLDWIQDSEEDDTPVLMHQIAGMRRAQMIDIILDHIGMPLFVKPPNLGSSIGISLVRSAAQLPGAVELALRYDRKVLVEAAVPDAREIEVSVLGNEKPRASIAGEIKPSNEFYDYDAKYVDGSSRLEIPAALPESIHQAIQMTAIKGFLATEAEGMARIDFLLDPASQRFFLNEINTIPGFTQISMYPKLWSASGLPFAALIDELIDLALKRHQARLKCQTRYSPAKDWYR